MSNARDKQRAATAFARAFEMISRASAVRRHVPYEVPETTLDGCSEHEIGDLVRALGDLLGYEIGHPQAIAVLRPVMAADPTPQAIAETVAQIFDYNIGRMLSARDFCQGRGQYWASASAHKPEDDPDWGRR
jgi:hypothetical protein